MAESLPETCSAFLTTGLGPKRLSSPDAVDLHRGASLMTAAAISSTASSAASWVSNSATISSPSTAESADDCPGVVVDGEQSAGDVYVLLDERFDDTLVGRR